MTTKLPTLTALRLVDGSLIVGQLDTSCNESVTLQMPIKITHSSDGERILVNGSYYVPITEETLFTFYRKHIIIETTVIEQFSKYYFSFIAESFDVSDTQTLN